MKMETDTNSPTIYLSGAISNVPDDGRYWRNMVKSMYPGYRYEDPLDYHDPQDDTEIVYQDGSEIRKDPDVVIAQEVVNTDKKLIDQSDVVLVNWEKSVHSTGTDMEIIYAHDVAQTPVVVWSSVSVEDCPLWLRQHSEFISDDLDEVFDQTEYWAFRKSYEP